MADYTWRDETVTRRIYVLPSPTNLTEMSKVTSAITQDLKSLGISYWDNTVMVEASDEEIHLSFVLPTKDRKSD